MKIFGQIQEIQKFDTHPAISPRVIKMFALIKWRFLRKNLSEQKLIEKYPVLESFASSCCFCEVFFYHGCRLCPLSYNKSNTSDLSCCNGLYDLYEQNKTPENANKIIELIRSLSDDEIIQAKTRYDKEVLNG